MRSIAASEARIGGARDEIAAVLSAPGLSAKTEGHLDAEMRKLQRLEADVARGSVSVPGKARRASLQLGRIAKGLPADLGERLASAAALLEALADDCRGASR